MSAAVKKQQVLNDKNIASKSSKNRPPTTRRLDKRSSKAGINIESLNEDYVGQGQGGQGVVR